MLQPHDMLLIKWCHTLIYDDDDDDNYANSDTFHQHLRTKNMCSWTSGNKSCSIMFNVVSWYMVRILNNLESMVSLTNQRQSKTICDYLNLPENLTWCTFETHGFAEQKCVFHETWFLDKSLNHIKKWISLSFVLNGCHYIWHMKHHTKSTVSFCTYHDLPIHWWFSS